MKQFGLHRSVRLWVGLGLAAVVAFTLVYFVTRGRTSGRGRTVDVIASTPAESPVALEVRAAFDAVPEIATAPRAEELRRVAVETALAMAAGDGAALRRLAEERGARVDARRVGELRAALGDSPVAPAGVARMSDEEVLALYNGRAEPMLRVDRGSVHVLWLGKRPGFDSGVFLTPPATRTPNRKAFMGEPGRSTELAFASPRELREGVGAPEVVIVEFSGMTKHGRLLVCVAFTYDEETGWLPRAKACVGAPMLAPI